MADLKRIKAERAEHPDMADVPGGKTGKVTFTYVHAGSEFGDPVYRKVSKFDAALDAAIKDWLIYIAHELGQFQPDIEVILRKDGTVGPSWLSCSTAPEAGDRGAGGAGCATCYISP